MSIGNISNRPAEADPTSIPHLNAHTTPPMDCGCWDSACERLLEAIPESHRSHVARSLCDSHNGGVGLRAWVSAIAWRGGHLPNSIPPELVQVYLNDPEAVPLYDCESCGVAIPVRPDRFQGTEAEPEELYFEHCPICAGRTGWFLYVSRPAEENVTNLIRRSKPR